MPKEGSWLIVVLARICAGGARARLPVCLLLLGALLGGAVLGVEDPKWEEPNFLIEAIQFEGVKKTSSAPLLTQLRLFEGQSYSESELRRALFRLKRLPFVYDAQTRLEKGSERDRYILVIEITETSRLFLVYDGAFSYVPSRIFRSQTVIPGDPEETVTSEFRREATVETENDQLTLGARWFLGGNGMVFSTLDTEGLTLGYTQYNLFGSRAFATLAVRRSLDDPQCCLRDPQRQNVFGVPRVGDREASFALGLPIAGNHSIQLNLTWADESDAFGDDGGAGGFEQESLGADLRWFYDTTDDPLLPSTGIRTTSGVGLFETKGHSFSPGFGSDQSDAESVALFGSAVRYFDWGTRGVFWLGLETRWNRDDYFQEFFYGESHPFFPLGSSRLAFYLDRLEATASVGWARTLFERTGTAPKHLRLETTLDARRLQFSPTTSGFPPAEEEVKFTVGLAFRNRWSVVRFGVGYLDRGLR